MQNLKDAIARHEDALANAEAAMASARSNAAMVKAMNLVSHHRKALNHAYGELSART